jgi:phosphoribosylformylglycinamidine (FGAM) synthase-like enzyme
MAFAGELGLEVDLAAVPVADAGDAALLFSESGGRFLVGVAPEQRRQFESALEGHTFACIGTVTARPRLVVKGLAGSTVVDRPLAELKQAWKERLHGV